LKIFTCQVSRRAHQSPEGLEGKGDNDYIGNFCAKSLMVTLKKTRFSVCFRGISRLRSAFIFLQWFKLAHIYIQVSSLFSMMGVRKESINKFW